MRLINATTYKIHEFPSSENTPPFAILSHTWGDEECTLQDMKQPDVSLRMGYKKIEYCCAQALRDGLKWAWVDTCCIDKTSTAELSEAINSMFRWYRDAAICYAYLADVTTISELEHSRWFTRGWTLQELLSPAEVHFYSSSWQLLGSKLKLQDQLWKITGVDQEVLSTGVFDDISIAKRMSWAANRQTTRIEDAAYCLMGIFDINMPLLYGEGKKAFIRLQEEILKVSDDHSIFAWGLPENIRTIDEFLETESLPSNSQLHSLFASSPAQFTFSHRIKVLEDLQPNMPPIISSNGVRIELPVWCRGGFQFAAISCLVHGNYESYIAIPLVSWSKRNSARCGELVLFAAGDWSSTPTKILEQGVSLLIKAPISVPTQPPVNTFKIACMPLDRELLYTMFEVYCLPHTTFSRENYTLTLSAPQEGPHAALFFRLKGPHSIQGRDRIRRPDIDSLTIVPSAIETEFAVIIGGNTAATDGLWARCLLVLDEDKPDEDFKRLFHTRRTLEKYCGTKSQIVGHMNGDDWEKIFARNSSMHICQPLRTWTYSLGCYPTITSCYLGPGTGGDFTEYKNGWDKTIYGDESAVVDLQIAPSNLVEKIVFIYIEIIRSWEKESTGNKPGWWDYRHSSQVLNTETNRERHGLGGGIEEDSEDK